MLLILEPTETAGEGITQPRLCRLSDEEFYYVKGRSLTPAGLVNEYISAHLGKIIGLPIPEFELAELPEVLQLGPWAQVTRDMGFGPLFASKRVPALMEIDLARAVLVPEELRRDVAAFDYWIGNADRALTEKGGNPNLFWDVGLDRLVVLDHNLAFDENFSLSALLDLHIFRYDLQHILADDGLKAHYVQTFQTALQQWEVIVERIPDEWLYSDRMATMDAGIDFDARRAWLDRLCRLEGWGE